MTSQTKPLKLAVLIDGENASARIAEALFTEIATLGEATVRHIYTDFDHRTYGYSKLSDLIRALPRLDIATSQTNGLKVRAKAPVKTKIAAPKIV